ncbi:outer membrane beta-barrel protein [uncultured Endozoicomonas sp.]|uniref:outer membrane beta-barrel protein n=1 Tax=uncultured Endozoicomonas sp. TaxID=432652 RepID=UPI002611E5D1|nr:outer membrane beta-barrel protein [uncultured Endozoicomonas sp.]
MLKPIASALIASSVLMASSGVMADDWFVGGTVGKAKIKSDTKMTAVEKDGTSESLKTPGVSSSDNYFGLRAGKFVNDNIRVYINAARNSAGGEKTLFTDEDKKTTDTLKGGKIKNTELSLSMDYVDNLFSMKNTKYFAGGTLGLNKMEVKSTFTHIDHGNPDESGSMSKSKKDTGYIYGVQFGVIQEFTDNFSAELGYRYARTNNKASISFPGDDGDSIKSTFKQKSQKMPYMTVSYHF